MRALVWEKKESRKSPKYPPSREGHTFLYMPDSRLFLLFGGMSNSRYNDTFTYDAGTRRFEE